MNVKVAILVFSGRPNPSWELNGSLADEIILHWKELPFAATTQFPEPKLGYQGCRIDLGPGEYFILFKGYGFVFKNGKQVEQRMDQGRKMERRILSTAPGNYKELVSQIIIV